MTDHDERSTHREIDAALEAYGSAFLYDGRLLDPSRVTIHHTTTNRWAAFTLDELQALSEGSPEWIGDNPKLYDVFNRVVDEILAELERRKANDGS